MPTIARKFLNVVVLFSACTALLRIINARPQQIEPPSVIEFSSSRTFAELTQAVSSRELIQADDRSFSVEDAISHRRVVNDILAGSGSLRWSPDGKYFIVQTSRGDLQNNTSVHELWLFNTASVKLALEKGLPSGDSTRVPIVTMRSATNEPAIKHMKWLEGKDAISFIGESSGKPSQVFTYDLAARTLTQITNSAESVIAFDLRGITIIYSAVKKRGADWLTQRADKGYIPSDESLAELVNPSLADYDWIPDFTTHVIRIDGKGLVSLEETALRQALWQLKYWLSPNGRYAIGLRRAVSIPKAWEAYSNPRRAGVELKQTDRVTRHGFVTQYVLIDCQTGQVTPLLNAPQAGALSLGYTSLVIWSADSSRVIVSNTLFPLEHARTSEEQKFWRNQAALVEIEVPSLVARPVTAFTERPDSPAGLLSEFKWVRGSSELSVITRSAETYNEQCFAKTMGRWERTRRGDNVKGNKTPETIIIEVEEGLNVSPKLVARSPLTQHRVILRDFNPQLADLKMSRWQIFKWKDRRGKEWEGGLLPPVDFKGGVRYPLVIQTHGFPKDRFIVDGPFSSAFAAQPLASRGFMVLQVPDDVQTVISEPDEASIHVGAYETAVARLDELGWVDPLRVGLIGFSRTCYHVKYALTHSKIPFAAATAADGMDMGYFQYLTYAQGYAPPWQTTFIEKNMGMPFRDGFESWLKRAPGFNAGRVKTPLRSETYSLQGVLTHWEMHIALKTLKKPTELVIFPDGAHELVKPRQRYQSLQGNVDWFQFWLQGKEDTDPAKREQYARWRDLRKLREENRKKKDADASPPSKVQTLTKVYSGGHLISNDLNH